VHAEHGRLAAVNLSALNAVTRHDFGLVGPFLAGTAALLAYLTFAMGARFFLGCAVFGTSLSGLSGCFVRAAGLCAFSGLGCDMIAAGSCGLGCAVFGTTLSGLSSCFVRAAGLFAICRLGRAGFFLGGGFLGTGRLFCLFLAAARLWSFLSQKGHASEQTCGEYSRCETFHRGRFKKCWVKIGQRVCGLG
jgi:hypothetical protein